MFKPQELALLGARIPSQLKEKLSRYCVSHGIKMNYFVSEAIQEKLEEIAEEKELVAIAAERLKSPKFISQKELERHLTKRGI